MTTSPTPATPSPEQKMREAITRLEGMIAWMEASPPDAIVDIDTEGSEKLAGDIRLVLAALPPTSHQPAPCGICGKLPAESGTPNCSGNHAPAPISSAPDGAGTPEVGAVIGLLDGYEIQAGRDGKAFQWSPADVIRSLEQQRDALKRDLGLAQARIKELEAK